MNNKDPNIFYNRGNVYLNINDFERAREEFDAAIRLQPTNPKFFHAKGLAYEAEALLTESLMLANPSETRLDESGYPIENQADLVPPEAMSTVEQQQVL